MRSWGSVSERVCCEGGRGFANRVGYGVEVEV